MSSTRGDSYVLARVVHSPLDSRSRVRCDGGQRPSGGRPRTSRDSGYLLDGPDDERRWKSVDGSGLVPRVLRTLHPSIMPGNLLSSICVVDAESRARSNGHGQAHGAFHGFSLLRRGDRCGHERERERVYHAIECRRAATLVAPSGSIATATPAFSWNAVALATQYLLWVDDSSGGRLRTTYTAAQVGCATGIGTCSMVSSATLNPGTGQWWVVTSNASGSGPWSNGLTFTVAGTPPPPAATLVAPSGSITGRTPTCTWNAVARAT